MRSLLGVAVLLALLSAATPAGAAPRPRCPPGGKDLVRTQDLRVYATKDGPAACLFSAGRSFALLQEDEDLVEGTRVAAAGRMVAAAVDGCYDPNFCTSLVVVFDLRARRLIRSVATPFVERLAVAPASGAVAFSVAGCAPNATPGGVCELSEPSAIYVADGPISASKEAPYEEPRRLAQGAEVDPLSLRVVGRRVSWLQAGVRRSARLRAR